MAHRAGPHAYEHLTHRLNRFPQGAPPSDLLLRILRILFSEREAALVSLLPIKPFTARRAAALWKMDEPSARGVLEGSGTRRWARYRLTAAGERPRQAEMEFPTTQPARKRADRSAEILELLRGEGPLSATVLATRLELSPAGARHWLHRLKASGQIRPIGAPRAPGVRYEVTEGPAGNQRG